MRDNERISKKELGETVKTATLVDEAPPDVQVSLRMPSDEPGIEFEEVTVANDTDTNAVWANSKHHRESDDGNKSNPKGKSQSKGKRKRKQFMSINAGGNKDFFARACFGKPENVPEDCEHRARGATDVARRTRSSTETSSVTSRDSVNNVCYTPSDARTSVTCSLCCVLSSKTNLVTESRSRRLS